MLCNELIQKEMVECSQTSKSKEQKLIYFLYPGNVNYTILLQRKVLAVSKYSC